MSTTETAFPQVSGYTVINSLTSPNNRRFNIIPSVVGEGYVHYSRDYVRARQRLRGEKMPPEDYANLVYNVAEKMVYDRYLGHSTQFLVYNKTVDSTGHLYQEIAATSRLVKESDKRSRGLPRLESVRLTVPDREDGWKSVIKDGSTYGDIGRVVVVKDFRRQGLTTEVVQQMIDGPNGVTEVAMKQGVDYILMDAQRKLVRHMEQTSLEIVEEIPIKLRSAGILIARSFPGYWRDEEDKPQLIVMKVPSNQAA
ncbi:MAG: hypothetical protein ACREHC_04760 [Candidatus Levyibacteriota bacterium]